MVSIILKFKNFLTLLDSLTMEEEIWSSLDKGLTSYQKSRRKNEIILIKKNILISFLDNTIEKVEIIIMKDQFT